MKVRDGFVSNSSSSSFILDGTKYTQRKLKHIIEHLLQATILVDETTPITADEICTIHEEKDGLRFLAEMKEFNSYGEDSIHEEYYNDEQYKKPVIIIDSISSNSIPWPVQEFLEGIAIKRQHWG
jgi:hypothetical protein